MAALAARTPAPTPHAMYRRRPDPPAEECLDELNDVLDDAPTRSSWPVTDCAYTSTLAPSDMTSGYLPYRASIASWYSDDLEDIASVESACPQYGPVFDALRACYVTGALPAGVTAVPLPASTEGGSEDGDRRIDLSPGVKAGIAVGIIVVVFASIWFCCCCCKPRWAKRRAERERRGVVGEDHIQQAARDTEPPPYTERPVDLGRDATSETSHETGIYLGKLDLADETHIVQKPSPAHSAVGANSTGMMAGPDSDAARK